MDCKEKAKELVNKFYKQIDWSTRATWDVKREVAKQCALICVDEMYKANTDINKNDYLIELKDEIEKL